MVIVIPDGVEGRVPTLNLEERTTMTDATIAPAGMAELPDKGPESASIAGVVSRDTWWSNRVEVQSAAPPGSGSHEVL